VAVTRGEQAASAFKAAPGNEDENVQEAGWDTAGMLGVGDE